MLQAGIWEVPVAEKAAQKSFSPLALWAMSFGCCAGWGAFVMPAATFLPMGGPAGSSAGLVLGALALMVISCSYGFLAARHPGGAGNMRRAMCSTGGIPAAPAPTPMSST